MLIKLLKHEFRATGRLMLPMYLVLLVTALGANLSARGMLNSDFQPVETLTVLLTMAFGFAVVGVFLLAFILMLQRFYKNLLQDEGYLMLTLPVSIHEHIWSKLIVSSVWFAATVIAVCLASMVVAFDISFLRDFTEMLGEIVRGLRLLKVNEVFNGTVLILEFIVLAFLMLMAFSLQFYAALAAGHSRPSHKMAWSIGAFFGFQFAVQFCGTTLLVQLDRMGMFHFLKSFNEWVNEWNPTPLVAACAAMLIVIAFVVLYGAIFYAVTTFFLKRHLNLE